jgi:hypothetical protein
MGAAPKVKGWLPTTTKTTTTGHLIIRKSMQLIVEGEPRLPFVLFVLRK